MATDNKNTKKTEKPENPEKNEELTQEDRAGIASLMASVGLVLKEDPAADMSIVLNISDNPKKVEGGKGKFMGVPYTIVEISSDDPNLATVDISAAALNAALKGAYPQITQTEISVEEDIIRGEELENQEAGVV